MRGSWFLCPICGSGYSGQFDPHGPVCGDLSRGQAVPCPGVLVPIEWQPEFTVVDVKGAVEFWCQGCRTWHHHSPDLDEESGHRVAHCHKRHADSPEGYFLYRNFGMSRAQVKARNMAEWDEYIAHVRTSQSVVVVKETQTMSRLKTEFFKSGDSMAIRTNATTEAEFLSSAATVLHDLIEGGQFQHDWKFQLEIWLPQIIDITCKLRGYKSDVDEQRVITAGRVNPPEGDRVAVFGESAVAV